MFLSKNKALQKYIYEGKKGPLKKKSSRRYEHQIYQHNENKMLFSLTHVGYVFNAYFR